MYRIAREPEAVSRRIGYPASLAQHSLLCSDALPEFERQV
jgi:hypothetical protein